MKNTTTGDTLCDPDQPVLLESMNFPAPVIHVAIEPKTKADQEKLGKAIQRLAEEDPTFQVRTDEETGQTIIAGMGELHLDVLVDRMRREFRVEANVGKPQVAYRETISQQSREGRVQLRSRPAVKVSTRNVQIDLEPSGGDGGGYEFVNDVTGGRIPKEYIPASTQVARRPWSRHPRRLPARRRQGHAPRRPFHEVDSSEMAFKIAGSMALKEAARRADPTLLEPMMAVEVTTPDDYIGDVIGDLNGRRGQIQSWRSAEAPGSSRLWFRCRRCSATSVTCGPRPQGRAATRCSSTRTTKCRIDRAGDHRQGAWGITTSLGWRRRRTRPAQAPASRRRTAPSVPNHRS